LPLAAQAKLLRAIQSGDIQRVGSDQALKVDVRIVAATNRNLSEEVAEGRFRADLYHRLSIYPISVPSLEDRKSDIGPLSGFFLTQFQRKLGHVNFALSIEAEQALYQYHWPGNIRELEHVLSRAALKARSQQTTSNGFITLEVAHLDLNVKSHSTSSSLPMSEPLVDGEIIKLKDMMDLQQKRYIETVLNQFNGNKAQTAKALGVDRANFHRLLKRLGLH